MSLLFNTLSRFAVAFLPRSTCLLISFQSPSAVILEPKKIKSVTISISSPMCHEVMGPDVLILVFWMLRFKQLFHSPLSRSSRGSLVRFRFPAIRPVSSACLRFLILLVSIWPSSESLGMAEFHYGHSIRCALIQLHLVHTAGLLTKCKSWVSFQGCRKSWVQ